MDLFTYVRGALPILNVVQDFVQLRQAGNYWKGSCPFHSETDASFTVSPDRQIFYCFGCHATGDVVAFVAKRENVNQIEAAKFLIERYNITIPDEILKNSQKSLQLTDSGERERYYVACEKFSHWCHQALLRHGSVREYLEKRGISQQSIENFEIGYFPGGLQATQQLVAAMARHGVLAKDLIEFGFVGERKAYFYSPFEERIIFPIKDQVGRTCAFGGRIFKQGDERAKYYNSKESSWFIKGKVLYGLDKARKGMQERGQAFLVEGYMDCVMMVQHGFTHTVATLGTACTVEHLRSLARYAHTLYVLYDGDNAGQNAILRMTELCWEVNLDLAIVSLPYKEDPASLLARGVDLNPLVAGAQDIIYFFVSSCVRDFKNKPLSAKLAAIHKIFDVIKKMNDPLKRDLLLQQTSLAIDLPFQSVKDGLQAYARVESAPRYVAAPLPEDEGGEEKTENQELEGLEQRILYGILANLQDVTIAIEAQLIPYFSDALQPILKKILGDTRVLDRGYLNSILTEEEKNLVSRILLSFDEAVSPVLFDQLKALFCKRHWRVITRDFKDKIHQAQGKGESERVQELVGTFLQLKQGFADKGLL